jgi:DNA-binding NarL/FixJ family response regulator
MVHDKDPERVWVIAQGEHLPASWKQRAQAVYLVPLLPGEALRVLTEEAAPQVSERDQEMISVIARGGTAAEIADELGLSLRTAQRSISRLRERFGLATKAELVRFLTERGF